MRERGEAVCVGPIRYVGHAAVKRDIDDLKTAMAQAGVKEGFLPVVAPSSAVPIRVDEYYDSEEEFVFALADAINEEYRAITDAGLNVQVDDAYLATMYDTLVPPGDDARLPRVGGAARRGAQARARGVPPQQHALPRLLGKLERPAQQ